MNTFKNLSHEDVYILDQSLVLGYVNNDIIGWKGWVDDHLRFGKRFFILPSAALMLNKISHEKFGKCEIPDFIEVLRMRDGEELPAVETVDAMNEAFAVAFNVTAKQGLKYSATVETIALAGLYTACSAPGQIADVDVVLNRVVFATANARAISRLLLTDEKQMIFEKILDKFGFGHLIGIRLISYTDTMWMEI